MDSRIHKGMVDKIGKKVKGKSPKGLLQYKAKFYGWPDYNANPP